MKIKSSKWKEWMVEMKVTAVTAAERPPTFCRPSHFPSQEGKTDRCHNFKDFTKIRLTQPLAGHLSPRRSGGRSPPVSALHAQRPTTAQRNRELCVSHRFPHASPRRSESAVHSRKSPHTARPRAAGQVRLGLLSILTRLSCFEKPPFSVGLGLFGRPDPSLTPWSHQRMRPHNDHFFKWLF